VSALGRWWRKLTGRTSTTAPAPDHRPARPEVSPRSQGKPSPTEPRGLELAGQPPPKKPSRVGAAGFDPYSSDGGYAKPGGWDRVDHD
jgi:hypothetical protein